MEVSPIEMSPHTIVRKIIPFATLAIQEGVLPVSPDLPNVSVAPASFNSLSVDVSVTGAVFPMIMVLGGLYFDAVTMNAIILSLNNDALESW